MGRLWRCGGYLFFLRGGDTDWRLGFSGELLMHRLSFCVCSAKNLIIEGVWAVNRDLRLLQVVAHLPTGSSLVVKC